MQIIPSVSFRSFSVNTKIIALAAAVLVFGADTSAHAASSTWTQPATATESWDVIGNWNSGSGPIPGATGAYSANTDTATFNAVLTGTQTVLIDSSRNIENLAISSTGGDYFFQGGPLILTGGGSVTLVQGNANNTVLVDPTITLEGNYTFSDTATSAALEFGVGSTSGGTGGGAITEAVTGTLTLTGTTGGAAIDTPSNGGPIIGGALNQASGQVLTVVKAGTGTWQVTQSNSYSGNTTIDGGVLDVGVLANEGSLSSIGLGNSTTGSDLIINGGVLQYSGPGGNSSSGVSNNPAGFVTNRLFTIGDSTGTANTAGIDSSNMYGNFTLPYNGTYGAVSFTNKGAIAFSGTATTGSVTFTLSGTNIANNTFNPQLLDPNTAGGDLLNFVKTGPGVWVLGNTNSYTGTTTLNGGILGDLTGSGVSANSAFNIQNGVYQNGVNFNRTLGTAAGNVEVTGGRSGFSANNPTNTPISVTLGTPGSTVQFGSSFFNPQEYILNAQTANANLTATNNYDLNGATRTIMTNANTAIISGTILDSSAVAAGLNKAGNGMLELTAVNSYTGLTGVSGGVLWATGAGTLGTNTGVINVGGGELRVDSLSDIPGTVQLNHGTLGVTFNATQAGLASILNSNSLGILALDAAQSNALNMAALGNGAMYLGSSTAGTYSASTLGVEGGGSEPNAGAPNNITSFGGAYRLGGGGGTLTLTGQNVLTNQPPSLLLNNFTGTTPSQSLLTSNNYNSVIIGDSSTAGQPNGGGVVDLQNTQNYLGFTTVNAGSTLNLDYSGGLASISTAGNVNIISQYSPVTLNGGTLEVTGGSGSVDVQTLGGVTSNQGAGTINVNANGATSATVNAGALTANRGSYFVIQNQTGSAAATVTTTTALDASGKSFGAQYLFNNNGTYSWAGTTSGGSPFTIGALTGETTLTGTSVNTPTTNYDLTATGTTTAAAGGYTLNLLRLTPGSAGGTLALGTNVLNANGILYNGVGGETISGTSSGITSSSGNLYIYNYGSGTLNLADILTGSGVNVTFGGTGVISQGTGFAINETYTGLTYLDGATMAFGENNPFFGAATSGIVINSGALEGVGNTSSSTISAPQYWNGNFSLLRNATGIGTAGMNFTGPVTLTNNITITENTGGYGGWTYSGAIGDAGFGYGVTVGANSASVYDPFGSAVNTVLLMNSGANSFTGQLTILGDGVDTEVAGALNRFNVVAMAADTVFQFGNSQTLAGLNDVGAPSNTELVSNVTASSLTLTLFGGGNYSFGGVISDSTPAHTTSLTMDGLGTQTLTGSNSFTGAISANAGTLIVDASKGGSLATATLDVGGGTYEFIGASTGSGTTESFTSTAVNGTGQSKIVANSANGATTLNLGNLVAATAGSVVDIAPSASNATITTTAGLSNGVLGLGTVVYTNPTTGLTTWATTSGGTPSPIVAYTGDSTVLITSGANSNTNYMLSGSQTETANTSINLLRISNSSVNALTVNSGFTLSLKGDGLLDNGTAAYTITGGGLNSTSGQLIIQNYGTGGPLTIASNIVNAAATAEALVLAGTGTTILTGTNTYTGATYFDGGTTNFNSLANFQNTPSYTFAGGTLQYATGNTVDFTKTAAGGTALINVGISGGTVDTNGNAVTWSKAFGNSGTTGGGLNFTDSFNAANPTAATGSVTIGGNITYSGFTTVSSGGVVNLVGNNVGGGTIVGNGGMLEGGTTQITSSTQSTGASDAGKLTLMAGGVIAPGSPGIGTTVNNGSNGGIQAAGHGGIAGGNNAGDQNANVGSNVLEASQLQWYAGGTLTFYLDSTTTASSAAAPAASTVLNLGTGALAKMGGTGQYILNFAGTGGWNTNGSPNVYDLINFGLPSLTNNFNPNGNTDFTINDFTIVNLNGVGVLSLYDNTSANGGAGQEELILTVIPEPSTWAMLIGGLATLIFWTRRKRATSTRSFARK